MSTEDFIIGLFIRVDSMMIAVPKHSDAHLYPSEIVTVGVLFALKGVGPRPFYRWLRNNYRHWFPRLPERTRLFRLLATHTAWTEYFLAQPTTLGVADTYGIELIHPWREDRADLQIGGKGLSNHRWIVGAKLAYLVNQYGLIVAWDYAAANAPDNAFRDLIADFADEMVVLTDSSFHRAEGDPPNQKAWDVERTHGRGDDLVAVDDRLPSEKGESTHVDGIADALGVHHGAVQYSRVVGRNTGG